MGLNIESSALGSAGIGIATGLASQGINSLFQQGTERRNLRNTKNLMELQQRNQMELNEQSKRLALEQWQDTNYEAQRNQLEKAGLNAGLLYGMGGSGGATTQTGSGGSAASGSAPNVQQPYMDIGQMAQIALMKAQKENIEADTANKKGQAENQPLTGKNITANTVGQEITNTVKTQTQEADINKAQAESNKEIGKAQQELTKGNIAKETYEAEVEKAKAESINTILQKEVMTQGIKLSEAQIQNMAQQIALGKFNANQSAEFKSLDTVAGSQLNKLINKIYSIFGIKEKTETQDKIK